MQKSSTNVACSMSYVIDAKLNRLRRCFFLASGLKVNFHKSKVYGVSVNNHEVERLASS